MKNVTIKHKSSTAYVRQARNLGLTAILIAHVFVTSTSHASWFDRKSKESTEPTEIHSWDDILNTSLSRFLGGVTKIQEDIQDSSKAAISKLNSTLAEAQLRYSIGGDIKFSDDFNIKISHSESTGPAKYSAKYYERKDKWQIGPKLSLTKILNAPSPMNIGAGINYEINFFQYFTSLAEARTINNKYFPDRTPINSEIALQKLKPGDMASIEGEMNLFFGSSPDTVVPISAGNSMAGRMRAYIFRGDNNMFRIRISAIRLNGLIAKLEVGLLDLVDLSIGGLLEKFLNNVFKINKLVKSKIARGAQDDIIYDFTLDMNDSRVMQAYDGLFHSNRQADILIHALNPLTHNNKLRNNLLMNVMPLIKLSFEKSKDNKPLVVINFSGTRFTTGSEATAEAGLSLLLRKEGEVSNQFSRLRQDIYDKNGNSEPRYFVFPSWVKKSKQSKYATQKDEKMLSFNNVIFEAADNSFQITKLNSIGFYFDYEDNDYGQKDHDDLIREYEALLPRTVFDEVLSFLYVNDLVNLSSSLHRTKIKSQFIIEGDAFKFAENASAEYFEKGMLKAVQDLDAKSTRIINVLRHQRSARCLKKYNYPYDKKGYHVGPNIFKYCTNIARTAETIRDAFNPSQNLNKRAESFIALGDNKLFNIAGRKLFIALIPVDQISKVTYFKFNMEFGGTKKELSLFIPPDAEYKRKFYDAVSYIQDMIENQTPDLRLEGTENSRTTFKVKS